MATLSARDLNRATLARQLLLERAPLGAVDGVRRVVALQAQQPASPYVALWNRLIRFDPTELDAAFADATVVKATLMRITLHAVHRDDHALMHTAMQPRLRAARLTDPRFTVSGLTAQEADELVPRLLETLDGGRSIREVEDWIEATCRVPPKGVWWAVRTYAPLRLAPTGGPWSFGQRPSYVASGMAPAPLDPAVTVEATAALVLRYLEGFGPASVADVAQFAFLPRAQVREAVAALGDRLERLAGADGAALLDVPGAPRPDGGTPAPPRLMAMWDSTLLAYADRSRMVPDEYRSTVIRVNGDVLPTLLVDGRVAGVWRPVDGGIEATAFRALPAQAWAGLADEARAMCAFLAPREPRAYGRYAHWWVKGGGAFDDAQVRLLPA